ncbi:MAG: HDOD domain-containing protein [bacterium]
MNDKPKSLLEQVQLLIESQSLKLPVCDQVALKIYRMVKKDAVSADGLADQINEDPSLASSILAAANSAYFAGLRPADTAKDAIVRLGMQKVANIAVMSGQQAVYKSTLPWLAQRLDKLWVHCVTVAFGAQRLLSIARFKRLEDQGFLAGLMHDIGSLGILTALEDISKTQMDGNEIESDLIADVVGALHEKVGKSMLKNASLPEIFQQVARYHDHESVDDMQPVMAAVRLANKSYHHDGLGGYEPDESIQLAGSEEAILLNLTDLQIAEFQVDLEDYSETKK